MRVNLELTLVQALTLISVLSCYSCYFDRHFRSSWLNWCIIVRRYMDRSPGLYPEHFAFEYAIWCFL